MGFLIDGSIRSNVDVITPKPFSVSVADFAASTGWTLKPEGFCQGDVCVPVRDPKLQSADGVVDVEAAAATLGRVVVIDTERGIAALGDTAKHLADQMNTLVAPDFTLPDLNGDPVSLHDFNRRKVLLLAWSSW